MLIYKIKNHWLYKYIFQKTILILTKTKIIHIFDVINWQRYRLFKRKYDITLSLDFFINTCWYNWLIFYEWFYKNNEVYCLNNINYFLKLIKVFYNYIYIIYLYIINTFITLRWKLVLGWLLLLLYLVLIG